jgi:hypothetical protein
MAVVGGRFVVAHRQAAAQRQEQQRRIEALRAAIIPIKVSLGQRLTSAELDEQYRNLKIALELHKNAGAPTKMSGLYEAASAMIAAQHFWNQERQYGEVKRRASETDESFARGISEDVVYGKPYSTVQLVRYSLGKAHHELEEALKLLE